MAKEVEPIWKSWQPSPESFESQRGEIYARIFLPYSKTLHFINQDRAEQEIENFKRTLQLPENDKDDGFPWNERHNNGNPMPGNITEDIYWATHFSLPVDRLTHIKQLAMLAFSTEGETNIYAPGIEFHHTRFNHSIVAGRMAESIAKDNGFDKKGQNLIAASMFIHDIATPAGGDPIKELDPEALDEEKKFAEILAKHDLSLLESLGFDRQKAISIVQGQGVLGKLGDIADKISYTAIDLYNYVGNPTEPDMGQLQSIAEPIRIILRENPCWADIYKEVKVTEQSDVYFENPSNLGDFLELRARMHKGLYLNPHNRGRDMILKFLTAPLYSRLPKRNYPLNSHNLTELTDRELEEIISRSWKLDEAGILPWVLGILPDYLQLEKENQIDKADKSLVEKGLIPIAAETIRTFNPHTDYLSKDPMDNSIKPYSEIKVDHGNFLKSIAKDCNRTVVYYWPETETPSAAKKLKPLLIKMVGDLRRRNGGHLPNYSLY